MKKLSVVLLVCSALLFSACSSDKKAESTDATSKQETKISSTEDSKGKAVAEAKKKAEEAEKKKQEEISKKVSEADTAMKAAEANLTDETIAAAKTAIEAIPGGNIDLQKRLETATANLEAIKQQTTQVQQQQAATQEQQTTNPDPNFIDEDGNGFDDRHPLNDPAAREDNRRREAEAQQQFWDQYNQEQQQQNEAVDQLNQYRSDFQAQNGREPTSGEIQSQWLQEQGLE